ncbi:MAG: SdrD B-like domain-containing protein, partial [Bacteroidota bacterium]
MKKVLRWQKISGLQQFSIFLLTLSILALSQSCDIRQQEQNQIALEQEQEVSIALHENQEQPTKETLSLEQDAINTLDEQGFSFNTIRNSLSNFFLVEIAKRFRLLWGAEEEEDFLLANLYATAAEGDINDRGDNQSGPVTNAVGAPDGNSTEIGASNDYIVLTLADELPAGTQYTLYIGGRGGSATAEVWEAPDGTTLPGSQQNSPAGFTQNGTASSSGAITMVTKTAGVATKFIYLQRGSGDILIDAVEYCLVTCQPTDVTAMANQATCSGTPPSATPNMDASIVLSTVTDGDRYHIVSDGDFTGLNAANATLLSTIGGSAPYTLLSGLANPSGSVTYTIRVFNGNDDACATDVSVTLSEVNCNPPAETCECEEYIYLNEVNGTVGKVHKYLIDVDADTTTATGFPNNLYLREITSTGLQADPTNQTGTAWYEGNELPSPHGLGSDINGFVYIGETNGSNSDIRKLTCDGDLFPEGNGAEEFNIDMNGTFNIGAIGNILYFNVFRPLAGGSNTSPAAQQIIGFDVCTRQQVGAASFGGLNGSEIDWGFYIDPRTDTMYATNGFVGDEEFLYVFTEDDVLNNNTIQPRINNLPSGDVRGVTTDAAGFIYVVVQDDDSQSGGSVIYKYNNSGTLLDQALEDGTDDNFGYNEAIGLVYSENLDLLFVSTESTSDDCVSVFNTDLDYIGRAVPPPPSAGNGKGIAIKKECCPTAPNLSINQSICYVSGDPDTTIFLQEYLNCEENGGICEGAWANSIPNANFAYDDCALSITISGEGCATFTITANNSNTKARCGDFMTTIEICTAAPPTLGTPTPAVGTCTNDVPNNDASITITGISNSDVVGVSTANATEYDGSIYVAGAAANGLFPVSGGTATITGLEHNADYIVRLFNQGSGCSDDLLNIMTPMIDCDDVILGAIGNYVWIDEDSDGFQDEGEPGIPNVAVVLYGDPDGDGTVEALDTTYTDSDGKYLFPDLPEGTYYVDVLDGTSGTDSTLPNSALS